MITVLAFPATKYLLLIAFLGLLDELLRAGGRHAVSERLKSGVPLLEALATLFGQLVGRHPFSRGHLVSVVLLTAGAYLLLFSLFLDWAPAAEGLRASADMDVEGSVVDQIFRFWLFFGLPSTALSLAVCRVVIGALRKGRLPARLRLPALIAGDIALTLVVTWVLYFGAMMIVRPLGPRQNVPETFDLTNLTFAYAIGFTSLSGVYIYAAFVSTVLILAVALARPLLNRLTLPQRFAMQPLTLAAIPVAAVFLLIDTARLLG
ncbi:MAG: hypothetical protein AAF416_05760 [Pseudomonadota bacterium]